MATRKTELFIHEWIKLPIAEPHGPGLECDRIGGVYLRLLARSPNANHDLFQVNAVINGVEQNIESNARVAALQLAKAIADLAIADDGYLA